MTQINLHLDHSKTIQIHGVERRKSRKPLSGNETDKNKKTPPVTIAVRPVPSIPCVTSSAVEHAENPEGPFLLNSHIFFSLLSKTVVFRLNLKTTATDSETIKRATRSSPEDTPDRHALK